MEEEGRGGCGRAEGEDGGSGSGFSKPDAATVAPTDAEDALVGAAGAAAPGLPPSTLVPPIAGGVHIGGKVHRVDFLRVQRNVAAVIGLFGVQAGPAVGDVMLAPRRPIPAGVMVSDVCACVISDSPLPGWRLVSTALLRAHIFSAHRKHAHRPAKLVQVQVARPGYVVAVAVKDEGRGGGWVVNAGRQGRNAGTVSAEQVAILVYQVMNAVVVIPGVPLRKHKMHPGLAVGCNFDVWAVLHAAVIWNVDEHPPSRPGFASIVRKDVSWF